MSTYQQKEKERIEKAGGLYMVAKDMDSFTDWWGETFKFVELPCPE